MGEGWSPSWDSICEQTWALPLRRRFLGPGMEIRRVRPGDAEYEKVIALRYRGFVETGFVDPARTGESAMRLARDEDSIILGLFRRKRLLATMTLNTITPRFPGMAMELDKKVSHRPRALPRPRGPGNHKAGRGPRHPRQADGAGDAVRVQPHRAGPGKASPLAGFPRRSVGHELEGRARLRLLRRRPVHRPGPE